MKKLLTKRWFLFLLIFFNFFFWFGILMIVSYILSGGIMHGENVGVYPKNMINALHSAFAVIGTIGLLFKIKKLYFFLFLFSVIGLGYCFIGVISAWIEMLFFNDPRSNPLFLTIGFIYPLFCYGGVLRGYQLLQQKEQV